MKTTIQADVASVLLESTTEDTETAVLFLPGISGKAHSDRFQSLVDVVLEREYACARIDIWGSADEFQSFSIGEITRVLDAVVKTLQNAGYKRFIMIGKSIGGAMALLYENPVILHKIMWAPALGFEEGEGNIGDMVDVPFAKTKDFNDIRIGTDVLKQIQIPITIIHGTEDDVMPPENSESIITHVSHGTFTVIEGADHSFKTEEMETELISSTKTALV